MKWTFIYADAEGSITLHHAEGTELRPTLLAFLRDTFVSIGLACNADDTDDDLMHALEDNPNTILVIEGHTTNARTAHHAIEIDEMGPLERRALVRPVPTTTGAADAMSTHVDELLRRNSIQFTCTYVGREVWSDKSDLFRFDAELRIPATPDRVMQCTYACDHTEFAVIQRSYLMEHNGAHVGGDLRKYRVVLSLITQTERVLASGGPGATDDSDFHRWLEQRRTAPPYFPDEPAYDPMQPPLDMHDWRALWETEKRTAADLLALIGSDEYTAWRAEVVRPNIRRATSTSQSDPRQEEHR